MISETVDIETKFRSWSKPPGSYEEQKCQNAWNAVQNAIKASQALKNRNIKVFSQGSYKNNTNVRMNSDVDIGIVCLDTFFYELPDGYSKNDFEILPASYQYSDFKNDVEDAIRSYFRSGSLTRSNKAFDLHETTYHVEADIAAFFEHRHYLLDGSYVSGVQLRPDNGGRLVNWPEQHNDNGVLKNNNTGRRYKALVRVLKKLSVELGDPVPGFLIECLVYNVPDVHFGSTTYSDDLRNILVYIYDALGTDVSDIWMEVSDLKYLFGTHQQWSKPEAQRFIANVWEYIGY